MALDLLIIDDEKDIRELVSAILEDEGFITRTASDSTAAIAQIRQKKPDLVILDVWLNDSRFDGIQLLDIIQEQKSSIPIIMVSGHGTIEMAVKTLKRGAYDFLEKPFTADRLVSAVKRAMEYATLKKENTTLKLKNAPVKELVGSSDFVQNVQKTIEKIAPTNSRVFIKGPAGSGKETIARLIHGKSLRSKGVFLEYNCSQKDEKKISEDLFGEANALENGNSGKVGILEQANNGTLHLKNIFSMPLPVQAKFVKALHANSFKRENGQLNIPLNVRIIASSCDLPETYIEKKLFREDLYYRLAVVFMEIAPLNERREDIPYLVKALLTSICQSYNISVPSISDSALKTLESFEWPGNVKQLVCAIEWAIIKSLQTSSTTIEPNFFPLDIRGDFLRSQAPTEKTKIDEEDWWESVTETDVWKLPLREARELFEKYYLKIQVKNFKGNISKTATFIGMERSALHRKLKTLNVQKEED